MEPYIADFLINKKIPKIVRYAVLIAILAFIELICIGCCVSSPFVLGKIVCCLIAIVMLITGIYLAICKIHRN